MTFPEPFNTISSTIILNIASDIVERQAQHLEGTLVGRLLKLGGLIEPDFQDRLRITVKQALERLFQRYPQYDLTGIDAFFRDPVVAQQIGDHILSRKRIDDQSIQQALERHLMRDGVTVLLMRKRGIIPQNIIPHFLDCYREVLNSQLSIPEMSLLLEILDQNDRLIAEIQASEARMKKYIAALLETKLSPQALSEAARVSQAKLIQPAIQERLQRLPGLFTTGLCEGRHLQAASSQYFVSRSVSQDRLEDWRQFLTEALAHARNFSEKLVPYFSGDSLMGGPRFCGICENILTTRFSIFLLEPSQDRNVYLELGIALGLGVPFFLIQHYEAAVPAILEELSQFTRGGLFDNAARQELTDKFEKYNFEAVRFVKNNLTHSANPHRYLIGAGECIDDKGFEESVAAAINSAYPSLEAVSLTEQVKRAGSWMIKNLIESIQNTCFALYRVDKKCSPTTFLALGISIALARPYLMVREAGSEVPRDLLGIGIYQAAELNKLKEKLVADNKDFFEKLFA